MSFAEKFNAQQDNEIMNYMYTYNVHVYKLRCTVTTMGLL